jgi:hypothetical protein
VAKRKSLFDDKPVEIQELTYIIKQDINSLNKDIANLQEVNHPSSSSCLSLKYSCCCDEILLSIRLDITRTVFSGIQGATFFPQKQPRHVHCVLYEGVLYIRNLSGRS